jgi:hypothetical protein
MSAAEFAPGIWAEMYRGTQEGPFFHGARFRVARVHDGEPLNPCDDCIPGYPAAGLELEGMPTPDGLVLCSCAFRPLGGDRTDLIQSMRAPPPDAVRQLIEADL